MNCSHCNGFNCKLWRKAGVAKNPILFCTQCLQKCGLTPEYIKEQGTCALTNHGFYVPAIEISPERYYQYGSAPLKQLNHWRNLSDEPTFYQFHLPALLTDVYEL